ncbi:MAG: PCI domain-containing protein [Promethearchaeia archaeon]
MPDKDPEDIFNELMKSSDDKKKEGEDLEEVTQKRCVTEFCNEGNESVDDLIDKFGPTIRQEVEELQEQGNLENYLKNNLDSFFNRIYGAWEQFSDGQINIDQFILSGITILRKKFIRIFINPSEEKEQGRGERSTLQNESLKQEEEKSSLNGVAIPSSLIGETTPSKKSLEEKEKPKESKNGAKPTQAETIKKKINTSPKKLKVKGVSDKKSLSISPNPNATKSKKQKKPKPQKKPSKIESLAPEQKTRSHMESIKTIAKELDKPAVTPMNYEKLDKQELKSVNLGSTVPGSPLYDEIQRIKDLIYEEKFDYAMTELEKLKNYAQSKEELDTALEKIEDIATNIGIYRSINRSIKSGDEMLNKPEKAIRKYEKAQKFAKTIGDTHYINLIADKISKANERVIFLKQKKRVQKEKSDKLKDLIKKNVKRLSKEETLMSLEDIRKYCNIPSKKLEFVEEIIIEMIKNKEVYGKYFTSSQKVMFDKENNREFLV